MAYCPAHRARPVFQHATPPQLEALPCHSIATMTTSLMLLVSHPIQYYVPLYRQFTANADLDSVVVYRSRVGVDGYMDDGFGKEIKWDIPLLNGYRYEFLSAKNVNRGIEPRFLVTFFRHRPKVLILHGYDAPANMLYLCVAKLAGTRVLIRCDTRLNTNNLHSAWYKRLAKRLIFGMADGFLSIGSLNRDYYQRHGVPSEKIHFAPFCVDNRFFENATAMRAGTRQELGIDQDAIVVLCVCKLIPFKRVGDAIAAVNRLLDEDLNVVLVLVGSGDCESELKQQAGTQLNRGIVFAGFRNQTEMPAMYGMADMFVFPSGEDPWGLALNEAMASGLPAVVSDGVGAAPDLVRHGETGYVYSAGDVDALTSQLGKLVADPTLRRQMGDRARALIATWSVESCVDAMTNAALRVIRR